uniref:PiggyBac transposable element-derived protein domain-containing protein n=1 Tax=Oryzias latipes TaxID=8090 RepID=A0A3P9MKV5_ORYLA
MRRRFNVNEVLDHIFAANEAEDTQDFSDGNEQASENEDDVEYQLEETDTTDQSEEEVTGAEAAPAESFQSKRGNIRWSTVPPDVHGRTAAANIIKMTPGVTRFAVTRVSDIKSCFKLFLPLSLKKVIIAMTNLEGKKVHDNTWKDIDETYLDAYIGVILLAGVYRSSNEATESLWDASTGRNIFRATMSIRTFQMISRVLRFDNRDTRAKSDKLAPIRDVWERWVQLLPLMFNPGPEVTVDERFLPFRGKCPFRQYMPSKPGKYGIKIWAACDAKTSYAWNLQIYTGKSASGIPEKNQGKRVVLDLTTGLQGHNITCDNFFTSYDLGQELLRRKLTMVGTVKKNKPELPAEMLLVKDRAPLSSKFVFTDTTTVVSYCPRKRRSVILMSTLHKDAAVSSGSDKKPIIILDYNKNKGGVDNLDKLTATYTCQRMTRRWPMVVFYNILNVSAYNAFVLWTNIHQGWNSTQNTKRRMFLEELGNSLVKPHIEQRERVPRDPAAADLVRQLQGSPSTPSTSTATRRASASPSPSGASPASRTPSTATATMPVRPPHSKRKRCQVCPSNMDRKTYIVCFTCNKYICKEHTKSVTFCNTCI